ncbi:MAG: DUF1428 domain-containing protein [Candidatus Paceibacterota bacterium]|jgi:uncharacterized protein YbaA (DUF1428 family)
MSKYVDGFLIPILAKNVSAYRQMAKDAGKVWKKYGALDFKECIGEDLSPKGVSFTFAKAVKLKKGEKIVFSYILYKSRAHRDRVNAKVMKDNSMNQYEGKEMPFDMKRMVYAGFDVIVDA